MDEPSEATYLMVLSEQEGEQSRLHAHVLSSSPSILLRSHEYMRGLLCFRPARSKESHSLSDHKHRQARFMSIVDALNCIYGRDTPFFTVRTRHATGRYGNVCSPAGIGLAGTKLCWLRDRCGGCQDSLVEQQLELVAQAHGACDAPAIFQRLVADQEERIEGRDLLPDLFMSGKEGHLLRAHPVVSHKRRADPRADLDEDVFAGTHRGDFLWDRAVGQHPVEER